MNRNWKNCQRGYTLVEVLIAAVVFTGVFLVMFTLMMRITITLSGSDDLRGAQAAEKTLSEFQAGGSTPVEATVRIDSVSYRLTSMTVNQNQESRLRLVVVRETTQDTIGVFYGERFDAEAQN